MTADLLSVALEQAQEILHPLPVRVAKLLSTGHINATWKIDAGTGFVLQRINTHVFRDIPALTESLSRTLQCLTRSSFPLAFPQFLPVNGQPLWTNAQGCWRIYPWIEGSTVGSQEISAAALQEAGRAFGLFLRAMADCDCADWRPTIPRFHDLRGRLADLQAACVQATEERLSRAAGALRLSAGHEHLAQQAEDLTTQLGLRLGHHDTKLENLLFSADAREALAVIDLDTVMPGLALQDFGDLVRSALTPGAEDEPLQDQASEEEQRAFRDGFEALARGYLASAGGTLGDAEIESLAWGPRYMTLLLGSRFLADYLEGDQYFPARYPEQNLRRAEAQLGRLRLLEENEDWMRQTLLREADKNRS